MNFLDILFYLFVAFTLIQIIYYLGIFSKFAFAKKQKSETNRLPISVIVCAKNEQDNLKNLIPLLLNQEYPTFELVLINDASSDGTLDLLKSYKSQYPQIKIVDVANNEAFWGNKKYALTLGIKAARYEHLLFIDADCYPNSTLWIEEMASHFNQKKTIVLGYGAYEKIQKSFLNKLIRFETLFTAMQYFSWAKIGKPYMGVGRNLAYKREEFFKTNGFINHMKLRSGDDDLFINEAANGKNTAISFSLESFTYSFAKKTFKDWFQQKKRHISTAKFYKPFDKMQLAGFYISQVAFLLLALVLLIANYNYYIIPALVVFRYIINWIIIGYTAKKLNEKDIIWLYPILEISLLFIQFNLFVNSKFDKTIHWK